MVTLQTLLTRLMRKRENIWESDKALKLSYTSGGRVNWYKHFGSCLLYLRKHIPCNPATDSAKEEEYADQKTCTQIFRAAVFVTVPS